MTVLFYMIGVGAIVIALELGVSWYQGRKTYTLKDMLANLTLSLYPLISTPDLAREAFFSEVLPADRLDRYHQSLQDESYFAFLDMLFKRPRPEKIEVALLVLGAENDTIFDPGEIEATARAYNQAPAIFSDMAHDMMLEPGWRSVADTMLDWIAALPPAGKR